jgi:glycosyltransferase involved in cell wall biosynthesis
MLVFEPGTDGHAREWLWHLLGHMLDRPVPERATFAVGDSMAAELETVLPPELASRVSIVALGTIERRLCTHRWLAVSGFARWWSMRRHLRRAGADHGQFLGLDHLSLPLALGLGFGGNLVSGILFRPSVHYAAIGRYQPGLRETMRDRRKALLYRLMLRNPALEHLLTLDPYFPAYARQHYGGGGKVHALPDPVHPVVPIAPAETALAARIPAKRSAFVLFGVLTERKGVLTLLGALERLKPQAAAQAAFLLAGRLDPAIRDKVRAQCRRVAARRPELWLHIEDRHLSPGEICGLVERADVVLAPYQRFVGSSGVLLWAAQAGRPLLAQDFGLIGRLVREHRLGLAVDASDAAALATAIGRMIDNGTGRFIDQAAARSFVSARAPESFAAMVLSGAVSRSAPV